MTVSVNTWFTWRDEVGGGYRHVGGLVRDPVRVVWRPVIALDVPRDAPPGTQRWEFAPEMFRTEDACQDYCDELNAEAAELVSDQASGQGDSDA